MLSKKVEARTHILGNLSGRSLQVTTLKFKEFQKLEGMVEISTQGSDDKHKILGL